MIKAAIALLAAGNMLLHAQTGTASLRVGVADEGDAVVVGAEVRLKDLAKGIEREASTNESGLAVFLFLEPGAYALEVRAAGFSTYRVESLTLEAAQSAAQSVKLRLGSVQESISVSSAAPTLDTASASLGSMVDRTSVDQLPLNGRNPYQLAQLSSSVMPSRAARGANPNFAAIVAVSINGSRAFTNEVLLDGVPVTGRADTYPNLKPSPDSVQEFRIQTNAYSAEFGRTGGGTLNFTTRSGTNAYRGTLWEFLRNDALDASTFFANANGIAKQKLRYNQFGGNFGGPIRKNRLFFFSNVELLRIRQSDLATSTVPTALMKRGDFSEQRALIYTPGAARNPFPANAIPASQLNSVGRNVASYFPDPSRAGLVNNYLANTPSVNRELQWANRIDWQPDSRHSVFFRYTRNWDSQEAGGTLPGSIATTTAIGNTSLRPWAASLDLVRIVTPAFVMHANAGFSRATQDRQQPSSGFDPTTLGFPGYIANGSGEGRVFPSFLTAGYASLGGLRNFGVAQTFQNNYSIAGDATWVKAKHSLKAGAAYRVYQVNNFRADDPAGNFSFTRSFTARTPTDTASGDAVASLLLGAPASGRLGIVPKLAAQNAYLAFFLQDDWAITPKLTLNIGLRWESDLPTTERYDRLTRFVYADPFPAGPSGLSLKGGLRFVGRDGESRNLSRPDRNNFGPRFGFAYRLGSKTVLRSGAGFFYAPMVGGGISPAVLAMNGFSTETPYIASLDNGVTPTPGSSLSNPFPNGIQQPPGAAAGILTGFGNQALPVRLDSLRNPKTIQWNLNLQRELPGHLTAEIAYAGSAGIGLLGGTTDLNQLSREAKDRGAAALSATVPNPFLTLPAGQRPPAGSILGTANVSTAQLLRPFPQFGAVQAYFMNDAHSSYHSMQTRIERRFAGGVRMQASYTFSKLIDDISAIQANANVQIPNYQDMNRRFLDKSLSTFDGRHRLVVNGGYALPFGKGRRWLKSGGALDWIAGGWLINGIYSAQAGFPLAISATPLAGQAGLAFRDLRPNLIGDPRGTGNIRAWFNTAAFAQPASFQTGNVSRTLPNVRGPALLTADLALHKEFHLRERFRAVLRAEAFNAFNRANFNPPGTTLGNPGFGVIAGTADPRNLQLALKLYF